jgi:hypothetical protein
MAMAECLGRYHLALYTAGDLPADESAALKSHLGSCRKCSASLDDLHKNVSEYERKASEHLVALKARLSEDSGSKERKTGRLWFAGIGLAAAITILILIAVVRPGEKPDDIAFKGAFSFRVVAQKRNEQIIVKEGEKLTKGDAIRFVVTTDSSGFVSVFSVDSRGRIFPFYPDSNPSTVSEPMRLDRPGKHELPGSVFLDEWIGTEYLVVVFSQEMFDRKRVLETARDTIQKSGIQALGPAMLGIEGSVGVVTIQKVKEHTP